ncbi:MAG: hypothetical protein GC160_25250 [Acidobacteria bacterium]|nr:hypothetical protein [Acidobacteriota bacterium]
MDGSGPRKPILEKSRMTAASTATAPRGLRWAVTAALGVAALALLSHIAVALWAQYSLTQVEPIIGIQAGGLAAGRGLYLELDRYPFTVSPYGPIFYGLSALAQRCGVAALLGGRLVSIAALLGTLWLFWRILCAWGVGELERRTGLALLACSGAFGIWGVVAQSDGLALFFSVAALERFAAYERQRRWAPLVAAGLCIALAIFTKQSFLAAGAAVTVSLLLKEPRRGLAFAGALAAFGPAVVAVLNAVTDGGYLANAVLANLNPFAWSKLYDHLRYFALASGGLALVAAAGLARRGTFRLPLQLYVAFSLAIWLLTSPKVGSDLNYQIEPTLALCLAAAVSLDRLRFFELLARSDPGWVTLLQIPLLLHLVLNTGVAVQSGMNRAVREQLAQHENMALAEWTAPERGRLLSVEIDPLLHAGRPMEVEPLIYTILVEAGVSPSQPVERDLETGAFRTVILYQDLTSPGGLVANPELPSLPASQLDVIRRRYSLAAHVDGPLLDGVFVYEPKPLDATDGLEASATPSHGQ